MSTNWKLDHMDVHCGSDEKYELKDTLNVTHLIGYSSLQYDVCKAEGQEEGRVWKPKNEIDDLIPADSLTTTALDGAVKLRMSETDGCSVKPKTLITLFRDVVNKVPDHIALGVKRNEEWVTWSYGQYYRDVQKATKSLIAVGLEPYHSVGILGFNSPEWFIAFLGAIHAGGKGMGIYATNSPDACQFALEDSQSNVIVVENNEQLQKILQIWHCLPNLKAIVQYRGELQENKENVYTWKEFLELGRDVSESQMEERLKIQAPNTCCSLIYTSGTTGNPKAVMISHDNITWTSSQFADALDFNYAEEILISFLPLSHIAAQFTDIALALLKAFTVYFAEPDSMKGSIIDTLKEVRPTTFVTVPRLWEKIQAKIIHAEIKSGYVSTIISRWAKGIGLKGTYAKMNGQGVPIGWTVANKMVFKQVQSLVGLDRCRIINSGAAPITKETLEFFASFDIKIYEVFGMSECTGPHTYCTGNMFRLTSVGVESPGCRTKLENRTKDGNGEICIWGRHIMMGYLNQPEKTQEAIGQDGWLRSGDIGKKDEDGFLYITGRIKEIIITSGGENIAPIPIEYRIKEELPIVNNCMLVGDRRKFLSILLTLKTEVEQNTMEPQPTLLPEAVEWCKTVNAKCMTVNEARKNPNVIKSITQETSLEKMLNEIVDDAQLTIVIKAIQAGIDKANKKAVSRASKIQKWYILPKDFSIPGGELGPTMKLRRPIVLQMYDETISALYQE